MTDRPRTTGDDRSQDTAADGFGRREFVALGAGASATLLAGCAGDGALPSSDGSDGSDGSGGSDGDSNALTGGFRLLISDAPADIGDFDSLDVTLSEARIFEASGGDDGEEDDDEEAEESDDTEDADDDGTEQTGNETDAERDSPNGTAEGDESDDDESDDENGESDDDDENGESDDDEDDDRGFTVVALDGATVDLTRVIDEDATAVFDGEIPAGSYEKVELDVSAVEGIVDGEAVEVKLPSEKLQITNGFEVTPEEPVSFVFDINVVKRGQNNGYILKPVISGSGVAGRDVEVNEIDDDEDGDGDESGDGDGDESESDDGDGDDDESESDDEESGSADDEESGSTTNESEAGGIDADDAQNGTATGGGD